jgi:hypothetical protein
MKRFLPLAHYTVGEQHRRTDTISSYLVVPLYSVVGCSSSRSRRAAKVSFIGVFDNLEVDFRPRGESRIAII